MKTLKNIWCSIHQPTAEQLEELGNVAMLQKLNPELQAKLNNTPSTKEGLYKLAEELLVVCKGYDNIVQPGGSPAFQYCLGIQAMSELPNNIGGTYFLYAVSVKYAHSVRASEDILQDDGSIKKISVFKHLGWI